MIGKHQLASDLGQHSTLLITFFFNKKSNQGTKIFGIHQFGSDLRAIEKLGCGSKMSQAPSSSKSGQERATKTLLDNFHHYATPSAQCSSVQSSHLILDDDDIEMMMNNDDDIEMMTAKSCSQVVVCTCRPARCRLLQLPVKT